jgi:hypothetical protein
MGTPPKVTVLVPCVDPKSVPVMMTRVPDPPTDGLIDVMRGLHAVRAGLAIPAGVVASFVSRS